MRSDSDFRSSGNSHDLGRTPSVKSEDDPEGGRIPPSTALALDVSAAFSGVLKTGALLALRRFMRTFRPDEVDLMLGARVDLAPGVGGRVGPMRRLKRDAEDSLTFSGVYAALSEDVREVMSSVGGAALREVLNLNSFLRAFDQLSPFFRFSSGSSSM